MECSSLTSSAAISVTLAKCYACRHGVGHDIIFNPSFEKRMRKERFLKYNVYLCQVIEDFASLEMLHEDT